MAVIGALYTVAVCFLCYYSIFYNIHINQRGSVCLVASAISLVALIIMLYTRKQIITRISSFIILPAMLPVVLLYFGRWEIIIPVIVTGVVILLLSGAGEGAKTAIGTIILLMYIFGALGYFLFTSFFVTATNKSIVKEGESPSGKYRYSVVNTEDSSNGSTAVYVEPNYADVKYPLVTFTLKNQERIVYLERPICEEINIQWDTKSRQDITTELNSISDDITVHLSNSELEALGQPFDSRLQLSDINVYYLFKIGKTAHDVEPIRLDTLTDDQLAVFNIGRDMNGKYYVLAPSQELLTEMEAVSGDKLYFSDMTADTMELFEDIETDDYGNSMYSIEADNSILLNTLNDQQLADLGVSETGDVMTFNDKICFRYYVAEIEDYYNTESRSLSVDLLN